MRNESNVDTPPPHRHEEAHGVPNADEAPLALSTSAAHSANRLKLSRDEMNLAEFPLTVLSKRADPSIKTLEFADVVKGKNGELINRKWIITGADKFGLPTSSDDEVLLGLLKLTADDGLTNKKIHFTRYELLKILRWTTEGRSYSRLQNALDRLSGVRIKATNAFYDNETKLHNTRNFGIIDEYEINDGRDTRPSFFTWSDVLFKSFQVGFIKKLDLDFYLDLQSAVSKRLYRYLDKHFWYRSRMQVNLFVLAHEKIGISRNYVYASSLRQQLEPALEELQEKGMLSHFEFLGKGRSTEVLLVAAHAPRKLAAGGTESQSAHTGESPRASESEGDKSLPRESDDELDAVVEALCERGLALKQAQKLIVGQGTATVNRIRAIIAHFDGLLSSQSPLISRNPAGFLYRAVENPSAFTLPGEKRTAQTAPSAKPSESSLGTSSKAEKDSESQPASSRAHKVDLEVAYLTARKNELDTVLAKASKEEQAALRVDVEMALQKLRAHISPQRFVEAVQHGVEQRLLERYGFPEFDTWIRQQT